MPNLKSPLVPGFKIIGSFTATQNNTNVRLNVSGYASNENSLLVWKDDSGDLKDRNNAGVITNGQTYTFWTAEPLNFNHLNFANYFFTVSLNAIIAKAPNLTGILLSRCPISENVTTAIATLTNLEVLDLHNTGATLDNFSVLNNLPLLRVLRLNTVDVTDDVANLPRVMPLLTLGGGLKVFGAMADMPESENYEVVYTSITGKFGDLPGNLAAVTVLNFRGNVSLSRDWTGLNNFSNVAVLNLRDWGMTQTEVDSLLEYLYTNRASFTQASKSLDILENSNPSGVDGDIATDNTGYGWIDGLQSDGWTIAFVP